MSINLFNPSGLTAPTQSTLASSGGLLVNIDNAIGDIARTTTGWIEDEKYGWYGVVLAGTSSLELDTAVTRTGTKTLKLSNTNVTGACVAIFNYPTTSISGTLTETGRLIPLKANTKYKFSCFIKTNNTINAAVEISPRKIDGTTSVASFNSTLLQGTNDWTLSTSTFTTQVDTAYLIITPKIRNVGNISDAWFDINSMELVELAEPVANSLTSSSPSIVSFTAVGSTDNIDQSQLTNTNTSFVGASTGTNYQESQSFTATKSKLTSVVLYKKANSGTPTGNFKVDIRTDDGSGNPTGTILATYTITLATYNALTANADFTVNVPCNLTTGTKYHIVCLDTATETGTNTFNIGKYNTGGYSGGDLRYSTNGGSTWNIDGTADLYFKTLYYKPTTNFTARQNNSTVSISADEDGFLNTSKYNLTTAVFNYTHTNDTTLLVGSRYSFIPNLYSYSNTVVGESSEYLYRSGNTVSLKGSAIGTVIGTYKINMIYLTSLRWMGCVRYAMVEYSYDNSTWTVINDNRSTTTEIAVDTTIATSGGFIYLRFTSGNAANASNIGTATNPFIITGTIDTSSLSTLRNYPTNKDIIKQYSTTLGSATTSATYRGTKWGFPAVEYSATEYQFLDIDVSATGSTVAFSELGTTYTPVADGASISLTSTSTPSLWVKTNITANIIYLSSNDYNASSDKDGSLKQSVVYQVKENPISSRNTTLSQRGKNCMRLTYG